MKCLNCNFLAIGEDNVANCRNKGHVVVTIEKAYEFYMIANELNMLDAEIKHRIINGGSIEW